MKKTIILSMCCMTALTASASSGPDETTLNILSIIFMVFGVLQIILFFKVWGMTNNVKKILNNVAQESSLRDDSFESKVRFQLLQGDKEAAQRLLITQFVKAVEDITYAMRGCSWDLIYEKDITMVVQGFDERMKSIGCELPSEIALMKTIGDYYKLYNPSTITYKVSDYEEIKV